MASNVKMAFTQKRQSRKKLENEEPKVPKLGLSFRDRTQLKLKQRYPEKANGISYVL